MLINYYKIFNFQNVFIFTLALISSVGITRVECAVIPEKNVVDQKEDNVGTSGVENASKTISKETNVLAKYFKALEQQLEHRFEEIVKTKFPQQILQMDDLLTEINKNKHKQLDGQFIKQLVEKTRPLFISLGSNLLLILSRLQLLTTNPKIKAEVTIYDELATTQDSTFARWDSLKDQMENLLTYQNKRAKLLRKLQRSQGDDAIVEFDQKFVDELSNDLEEQRDLNLVVLTMFERNLKHLMTHRENENQDQNHQRSMNMYF